jgi:hypothetical protein
MGMNSIVCYLMPDTTKIQPPTIDDLLRVSSPVAQSISPVSVGAGFSRRAATKCGLLERRAPVVNVVLWCNQSKEVIMKRLLNLLIAGALVAGSTGLASVQDSVKSTTKAIGQGTKETAKSTAKTTKKTTKKVINKGAKGTQKGAATVEEKTNTR